MSAFKKQPKHNHVSVSRSMAPAARARPTRLSPSRRPWANLWPSSTRSEAAHRSTLAMSRNSTYWAHLLRACHIAALKEAAGASYPTVVIDSLSHAWMGKGGLLDQADAKGGRFDA